MSQEIAKANRVSEGPDQQLVDNISKIFSNWAAEIPKLNDEGLKTRTDGTVTAWRQKSDTQQAKARAKLRSLTCDEKVKEAFRKYVSWLKFFLEDEKFATYVSARVT